MEEDLRKFKRLLRIVQYLQSPAGATVKKLATETGVDVRTIYRDLDELRDACYDIVQDRPKGPYRLSKEYALIGQTMTLEEVLCLGLGSCLLQRQLGDTGQEAMRKLQSFIKGEKHEKARELPNLVEIQSQEEHPWIPQLVAAVSQRRRVRFEYSKSEEPTRTLDPYTLFYQNERWYVQGFDHLRKGLRSFRLTRILHLEVLNQNFLPPVDYESKSALFHKWDIGGTEPVPVTCRVDEDLARWLRENPIHPSQEVKDGQLTLSVKDLDALAHWLLSLRGLEVLNPPLLRQKVADKAKDIWHRHQVS